MDIYKITGVLILITSICYLIVAILSLALVLGKKNLVKQNLSFTVMAGLIMPCFEAALFCAGTFMFTRIIAGEWKVPLIAALFMMAYCFISVFNYLYLLKRCLCDVVNLGISSHCGTNTYEQNSQTAFRYFIPNYYLLSINYKNAFHLMRYKRSLFALKDNTP